MKKILKILSVGITLCSILLYTNVHAANTHSLDLELSSSQYAYAADSASLSITGDLTMEAWVKLEQLPSTAGTTFMVINKYYSTGDSRDYFLAIDTSNKPYFWFTSTGGSTSGVRTRGTGDTTFVAGDVGNWVHLAVVIDVSASTGTFYKNGVAMTTTYIEQNATSIHDGTARFHIGASDSEESANSFFDGLIDEVRVWNVVRTETQINDNKSVELTGSEDNLVAYWKLNNSLLDKTSNNNDLTNVGSATFSTDVPFGGTVEAKEEYIIIFE